MLTVEVDIVLEEESSCVWKSAVKVLVRVAIEGTVVVKGMLVSALRLQKN